MSLYRSRLVRVVFLCCAAAGVGRAQHTGGMTHAQMHGKPAASASDSAFAVVQARGKIVMGVDQYTSTHHFVTLRDGGRISLERDVDDSTGVNTIRAHLRSIADAFSRGDFSAPAMVHMQEVPGAAVMAARRAQITYRMTSLRRGGQLRITTRDPAARAAVAEFLAFQRMDHRAH
jgi:hypothetical protein